MPRCRGESLCKASAGGVDVVAGRAVGAVVCFLFVADEFGDGSLVGVAGEGPFGSAFALACPVVDALAEGVAGPGAEGDSAGLVAGGEDPTLADEPSCEVFLVLPREFLVSRDECCDERFGIGYVVEG